MIIKFETKLKKLLFVYVLSLMSFPIKILDEIELKFWIINCLKKKKIK